MVLILALPCTEARRRKKSGFEKGRYTRFEAVHQLLGASGIVVSPICLELTDVLFFV